MSKCKVVIIDYDMGNVRSIENAINHVGSYNVSVSDKESEINNADIIILPGVGGFSDAMKKLHHKGLVEVLNKAVIVNKKPTLGICLGMQLLFESSEENVLTKGLGWIPGNVIGINPNYGLRVPHIGWNNLLINQDSPFFSKLGQDKDFYFVHSFYAKCDDKYILAKVEYGEEITASVRHENIVGMQFHPERSQKNGHLALGSFLSWAERMVGLVEEASYA